MFRRPPQMLLLAAFARRCVAGRRDGRAPAPRWQARPEQAAPPRRWSTAPSRSPSFQQTVRQENACVVRYVRTVCVRAASKIATEGLLKRLGASWGLLGLSGNGAGRRSGLLWALPPGPERALRWPQEAYKTLPEREIVKGLDIDSCRVVVVVVVVVIVVVFALFFLVVGPFVLLCSSREHRPTTPDN